MKQFPIVCGNYKRIGLMKIRKMDTEHNQLLTYNHNLRIVPQRLIRNHFQILQDQNNKSKLKCKLW